MILGYARVSTTGQNLETQIEKLQQAGCERLYQEKATGTNTTARPELAKLLENVRSGDIVVVTKIDRLARSIYDLNGIANELKEKKVSLRFIDDNLEFSADTDGLNSFQTLTFNIIGAFAQFERDLIVQRTSEGRERAKKQGKHLGRPPQPKEKRKLAMNLYDNREENGYSVKDIVDMTGVPRSTIYKMARERKAVEDNE